MLETEPGYNILHISRASRVPIRKRLSQLAVLEEKAVW